MEIKLPRLKVEYNQDEAFSLGKLSLPLIIGFGVHWAWVYITMFNGKHLFFLGAPQVEASALMFYSISLIFLTITLFSYGIFSRSFRRLFATPKQRSRNRFIGATCASLGTILLLFGDNSTTLGMAIIILGGVSTGVGSAVLLMSYGVSFGQCDIATIVSSTALSLVVGIIVYAIVLNLGIPDPFRAVLSAILPFIECYCLYRCSSVLIDKLQFAEITLKVRKAPFALRLCIPGLLFGIALGTTRFEAIADMRTFGDVNAQLLCIVIAAVVVSILMIAMLLAQRQHFNFMYRTMLPLITIALVWIYFDNGQEPFLSVIILLVCYLLFESILWVSFSDISQRFRLTAFIVFGFGRGSLALGAFLGSGIITSLGTLDLPFDIQTMTLLTLACMLIAYATLLNENEIRGLIISESDNPVGEMTENLTPTEPKSEETIRAGKFKRKCEKIANCYLLSKKETEVLFLLAKGRNAAYIQEQLFISEGTARTHMRHIYRKLDVHTQQELIDLVDAEEA